jgi:hypothetical protein
VSDFLAANSTLVLVLGFGLITLTAVLTPVVLFLFQWRLLRQAEIDAGLQKAELESALKREMLNRGLSAADIRTVMEAHADRMAAPRGPAKEEEAEKGWEGVVRKWAAFGRMWAACPKFGKRHCASGHW